MDPITIGIVGVGVVSAIAQQYQSAKARKASEAELKKIQAMWDALVPPTFDASITDPPEYIKTLPPIPDFDMQKLTPELYKVVAQYEPQAAKTIQEQAPEVIQDTAAGKEGRQAQIEALRKFKNISESDGMDPQMAAALQEAAQSAQVASQSRQGSILQDAARRGTLGAGSTLAAQLSGSEQAMSDQAAAGRQAAIAAYQNKLAAMREAAGLGGQITASDRQLGGQNAAIINAFNQRTSANAQNQANLAAQTANQGQLFNVQAAQSAANQNVGAANEAQKYNQQYGNEMLQQQYGNQMGQVQQQNAIAEALANWTNQQKLQQNATKQQEFGNEINIVGGKAGVGQMMSQNAIGAGQDKNAAIQGATNAAMSGAQYYGNQSAQESAQDRADKRAKYEKTGSWN